MYRFEICANSVASCIAAQEGGADRVELCAGIPEGGTTPSYGMIRNARKSIDLMASLNFNTLFVCTWCGSKTAWNSQVLLANSAYPDAAA